MTANSDKHNKSVTLQHNYFAALRFVLLTIAVLLLADFIFSLVASDIDKLLLELKLLIE